jgi:hypothetical protein
LCSDKLDLNGNRIGPGGADNLAGVLGQCRALAHLDLSRNTLRSEGVESLEGVLGQCRDLTQWCGKKTPTLMGERRGGRRGRKGFIVAVGWTGQEQERYEVVGQLPDY